MTLLRRLQPMSAVRLSAFALLLVLASACDSGDGASLYDPDNTGSASPTVSSVSPSGVVLAGVDEIVIAGTNFSATPSHNQVFFDDGAGSSAQGVVLEASTTSLRVKTPNLPNPNLRLRVAVRDAAAFSTPVPFPLEPAFVDFGDLDGGIGEEVFGIASDGSGGVLVSLLSSGASRGIKRFAADGTRSDYFTSAQTWFSLALASDNQLYGVRRIRAAFRLIENGAQQTLTAQPNGVTLAAIAADAAGNLWLAGSNADAANGAIYRVTTAGAVTAYPFAETVQDMVVAGGKLYAAAGTAGSGFAVWSFPVDATNSLGAGTVFYNATAELGGSVEVYAVEASADGTVFVGTSAADPLIQVSQSGIATPLYPGVLSPPISGLAWSAGSILYASKSSVGSPAPGIPPVPATMIAIQARRPAR